MGTRRDLLLKEGVPGPPECSDAEKIPRNLADRLQKKQSWYAYILIGLKSLVYTERKER